ncbi:sensor domain-containing diguanylate cyclase [Marinobacterium lutimaris]|uniref:diguanylate cyclase n=1 Tax=Marinobacterium lutimaris TaxID=568106 RepID=A0A1H6C9G0_9GAMM|nr:sensor domain-containing diguanylate cyclase [Marinobacterium lutimaris]SEG69533.1 PAS domain S-box-containing protein/diguanylate cyclase (GGDEF) domain-containing protein [Marinobacterium lutimaris]
MEQRKPVITYTHTSLEAADATLNNLLDLIVEGTWDWSRSSGEVKRSPGWYRMLGFEVGVFREDVFTWENLIHPDDYQRVMQNFEQFTSGQIDNYSIDYRCKKCDGNYLWITDNAQIIERDPNGVVTRIIGAHLDIHERKTAQLELFEQNRLLRADNVTLEKLITQKARELEIRNRELQQKVLEIELISNTDPLTQVPNRKKFEEELLNEKCRSDRYGHELSVAMLDIDHFKNINDTFGHETGDRVLKKLAAFVTENIREIDFFARWGGEEFVLIFPDVGLEGAVSCAQKLRQLIAEHELYPGFKITCSFGVTAYHSGDSLDDLFSRIDNALYVAKNSGRDQVVELRAKALT